MLNAWKKQNSDRGDWTGINNFFARWDESISDMQKLQQQAVTDILHELQAEEIIIHPSWTKSTDVFPVIIDEKEEISDVNMKDLNISYTIYSWIASQNKTHAITATIEGEHFDFQNFWFQELKWRFSVWINVLGESTPLIQNKLKNATKSENVDLKTAVNAMMRNIRRLLKSTDPKMKVIQEELRKYKGNE